MTKERTARKRGHKAEMRERHVAETPTVQEPNLDIQPEPEQSPTLLTTPEDESEKKVAA